MPDPFPTPTPERWRTLVDAALKGADFEKRLVSRTRDGLRVEPLYPAAEGAALARAEHRPWRIVQRVDHPEPAAANALALADLDGGADALAILWRGAPAARGFGLDLATLDDLDRALAGVMLPLVRIRLDAGIQGRHAAAALCALAERRGHPLAELDLDLGLDPVGAFAATGTLSAPWEIVAAREAETLASLDRRGFRGTVVLADGRPYHDAGASEAQELAAVLATGLLHLRALEAGGHPLERARAAIAFLLVADADEFLTVAKFRAFRRLWARVEAACGLAPRPARLDAETAYRMTTRRDPWVNVLRTTVAAFSAGLGSADGISILPFTTALGLPDAFARRLARNAQLVLLEEAHLWRVEDPAAGAGGFEALTDGLCEAAWAAFQAIEREGGIVASLTAGALQGRIAETAQARARAIATRREPITGTSEFPDLHEAPVAVLMPAAAMHQGAAAPSGPAAVAAFADLVARIAEGGLVAAPPPSAAAMTAPALAPHRLAEPFEALRDRADSGPRPQVFLATLGTVAEFTARTTFARNAFAAGGIEAVTNEGFPSTDAMIAAFRASGTPLACLCGTDARYADEAATAAAALKEAGATRVFVAGRPGEGEAAWRAAGVTGFVYAGCDLLAFLESALAAA